MKDLPTKICHGAKHPTPLMLLSIALFVTVVAQFTFLTFSDDLDDHAQAHGLVRHVSGNGPLITSNAQKDPILQDDVPPQQSRRKILPDPRTQRIVILPGPHKTGTTSVQSSLMQWIEGHRRGSQFHKWAYPIITEEDAELVETKERMFFNAKGFTPFFYALVYSSCRDSALGADDKSSSNNSLVKMFSKRMQEDWDDGYNLLVASETLDLILDEELASNYTNFTDEYWNRVLECLPQNEESDDSADTSPPPIVIGIQHRTPRIEQLISLWHQIGKDQTLLEFATDRKVLASEGRVMNSLGLADFFARQGYSVVVIDTGGMAAQEGEKVQLPIAAACYFLQMPCQTNQDGELGITVTKKNQANNVTRKEAAYIHSSITKNQREDSVERGIPSHILKKVNELFMEFDCQYQYLVNMDTVTLLYGNNTFDRCLRHPPNNYINNRPLQPMSKTFEAIYNLLCAEYPESKNCRGMSR